MKYIKSLSTAVVLGAAFAAMPAQADMITDAHGNVGYDTAEECDAAVHAGTAKFYQSLTHKKPFIRKGEKSVQTAKLSELGEQYAKGACDLGVGHGFGRDGVSKALQGKYIPFSPDMPVNVYLNGENQVLRVSMSQCDNRFSDNAPRPVGAAPAAPVATKEEVPVAETVAAVAPVIAAPVVTAKSFRSSPYVFGTVGAAHTGINLYHSNGKESDKDITFAGQAGAGFQFNKFLGAEAFYQGGEKSRYDYGDGVGFKHEVNDRIYGARLTAGLPAFSDKVNFFAKAGAAEIRRKTYVNDNFSASHKQVVPTAGLGATFALTDNLKLRADYDHFFSKGSKATKLLPSGTEMNFKCSDYLGVGLQYNF